MSRNYLWKEQADSLGLEWYDFKL